MKVAAVDIGANSVHLVVSRLHGPGVRDTLDRSREMIRLGQGTFRTGGIPEDQMRHAMALLRRFRTLSEEHGVEAVLAVATSAVRDAKNRDEFVRRAEKEARLAVRVLSGEEEARLIFLGVRDAVPPILRRIAVIDIGGGSVEVVIGNGNEVVRSYCLKLGSLRLAMERERAGRKGLRALEERVRSEILPAATAVAEARVDAVIGTSGTILTLAELLGVRDDGRPIRAPLLADLSKKLLRATNEENAELPAVGPKRADSIGPGSLVLRVFMEEAGINDLHPCEQALREGVVADYAVRNSKRLDLSRDEHLDPCRRSVVVLARRLGSHDLHAQQTARLALRLFDGLASLHGLGRRDRELLEYAALLHDAGYWISAEGHHKHAYYLIRKAPLEGFTPEEGRIIALVARYHRGALPRGRHAGFSGLSRGGRDRVRRLAALLRIADGLDRSHAGLVRDVSLQVKDGKVVIDASASGNADLEIAAADRRANLFRRIFDLEIEIRAGRNGKA
jgi:exopolyphosphatase/guanosine-5'-triphosphate,3'-diphosphate pyrophosphatase